MLGPKRGPKRTEKEERGTTTRTHALPTSTSTIEEGKKDREDFVGVHLHPTQQIACDYLPFPLTYPHSTQTSLPVTHYTPDVLGLSSLVLGALMAPNHSSRSAVWLPASIPLNTPISLIPELPSLCGPDPFFPKPRAPTREGRNTDIYTLVRALLHRTNPRPTAGRPGFLPTHRKIPRPTDCRRVFRIIIIHLIVRCSVQLPQGNKDPPSTSFKLQELIQLRSKIARPNGGVRGVGFWY